MPSAIDPTQPPSGSATTAGVRANMAAAKSEIEALQTAQDYGTVHTSPGAASGYISSGAHPTGHYSQTLIATANRQYFVPFRMDFDKTIDEIATFVSAAAASSKFRLGIYSVLNTGMPGELLAETADMDSTTTGLKAASITPLQLQTGWYYLSILHDAGATFFASDNYYASTSPLGFSTDGYKNNVSAYAAITPGWTAMQTPAPSITMAPTGDYAMPLIFLGTTP